MPKSTAIKVLIAHSNPLVSAGLYATLGKEEGLRVELHSDESCASPCKTLPVFSPDLVVADYYSGLQFVASSSRVVILTHIDSEASICQALERGARGYLLLDCGLQDLLDSLRSVHAGGIALAPPVAARVADRMTQQALTLREGQVLRRLTMGLSNKVIASELTLAEGTVKTHVKSILKKLNTRNRAGAVAIAQRRGLLGEDCDSPERSARRVGIRGTARSRVLNFQRKMRRANYQDLFAPAAAP